MVEICHTLRAGGGRQEKTTDVVVETHQAAQVGGVWHWSGCGYTCMPLRLRSLAFVCAIYVH